MNIQTFDTKLTMGAKAAAAGAGALRTAIELNGAANIIVATGASQFEMLDALTKEPNVAWHKVTVFHLDEYVGLPITHPASFRLYLWQRFASKLPLPLAAFHYVNAESDAQKECDRLSAIIGKRPIDVAFIGIGENGHLAFNDPPADLEVDDPYIVVNLDDACRRQQLGEGWFPTFEDVPRQAISMSIMHILKSRQIVCTVPDQRKAKAVFDAAKGPVTNRAPASVLQTHGHVDLFLDAAAATLLGELNRKRVRGYDSIMKFTKMHGLQNDYVYINGFVETVADPVALARVISDRHTGVGSDGLILILPSQRADVKMRMFNSDGSEGEMCGNGIRCLAKYVYDHGLSNSNPLKVETGRGVLSLQLRPGVDGKIEQITVNMGEPVVEPAKVPFDVENASRTKEPHTFRISISPGNELLDVVPVSVGNPHVAIYVDDVAGVELEKIGPRVEHHKAFPKRVNAHWVQVVNRNEIIMRTWERGSGITLACGTGASSVCVAGVLTGRTDRKILAHLPGGDLHIEWRESDNCVYMTGPAAEVFSGEWAQS